MTRMKKTKFTETCHSLIASVSVPSGQEGRGGSKLRTQVVDMLRMENTYIPPVHHPQDRTVFITG